ncbi:MAG TPA: hypothetical protein EYG63_00665 [Gammaproteobacteria bacterium]|jgi:hypothetical protein|nr:hypothetical protein [Gammaproteobacteria bacterium]
MAQSKVKTLDGTRTTVADLNIAAPHDLQQRQQGIWGKLTAAYKNLSQIMAGMYTGVGCNGTPNPFHSYEEPPGRSADSDAPTP